MTEKTVFCHFLDSGLGATSPNDPLFGNSLMAISPSTALFLQFLDTPLLYCSVSRGSRAQTGGAMSGERPGSPACLLRMGRAEKNGRARWRASLERPGDGKRFVFTSLKATFDFPREHTDEQREGSRVPPENSSPTDGAEPPGNSGSPDEAGPRW